LLEKEVSLLTNKNKVQEIDINIAILDKPEDLGGSLKSYLNTSSYKPHIE
jgi:hypothetical protein